MQGFRLRVTPRIALLALLLVSGVAGCSRAARHKVLTVFFTGVPPLEEQAQATPPKPEVTGATPPTASPSLGPRQSPFWVHGPYGAGNCGGCHEVGSSFRAPRSGPGGRSFASIQPAGARLIAPLGELCGTCHTGQTNETAESLGLWLHAPAARGLCVACHHPHQSPGRYMLRAESSSDLCTRCHDSVEVAPGEVHSNDPGLDCLDCHNPHLGKNSLLLRADYDETESGHP